MTRNQSKSDTSSSSSPSPSSSVDFGFDKRLLLDFGIDPVRLARLHARIHDDVEANKYPGAAIALARRGQIVYEATYGLARLAEEDKDGTVIPAVPAGADTMWLLYSQTKPIVASAIWLLLERGLLNLHAPVSYYMPELCCGRQRQRHYLPLAHSPGWFS